jgi:DNA-binding response OmpR family regulator
MLHSKYQVLIVEDETEISDLILLHLKRAGLTGDCAPSVEQARHLLKDRKYDLIILDWMLPGVSGVDFLKQLRSGRGLGPAQTQGHGPAQASVLMVTAKAEASNIVEGLDAGADDYLAKPFEPSVLMARVKALLRRHAVGNQPGQAKKSSSIYQLGRLHVNAETYDVNCGDEEIHLTPSEFKLLLALCKNRGRVLTRDALIDLVQGEGVSVVGRTIDTHVFGLRKKIGACSDTIETIRGVGYRVKPEED